MTTKIPGSLCVFSPPPNVFDWDGATFTYRLLDAIASVNTSSGLGARLDIPVGAYTLESPITFPDKLQIHSFGDRATIINLADATCGFKFPGVTHAGLSNMRIGLPNVSGVVAIDISTPGNVDSRWLRFDNLEIAPGTIRDNQIGIRAITSGTGIITECVFDGIRMYQVSSPFVINGPEGNYFTNFVVAGFGASSPTSAIGPGGNANIFQGRVAGAPFAGSIAYSETGARNIVDLIVDIGAANTALNVTGAGNLIRLSRPQVLTPLGTYARTNTVIDSEFLSSRHIVSRGTTPTSANFSLSAGFGSTATITSITGNDQRIRFVINCSGAGISAFPTIGYAFIDGQFPVSPMAQVTRDGGNQVTVCSVGTSANVSGWGFTFAGTPVAGESYVFVVTVG